MAVVKATYWAVIGADNSPNWAFECLAVRQTFAEYRASRQTFGAGKTQPLKFECLAVRQTFAEYRASRQTFGPGECLPTSKIFANVYLLLN